MKIKSQSGRSMVEMLGLLAVVGVLSVGGIAGYKMAMSEHRSNIFLDKLSKLFVSIRAIEETTGYRGDSSEYLTIDVDGEKVSYDINRCYLLVEYNEDNFLGNYAPLGSLQDTCQAIAKKINYKVFEPIIGSQNVNQFAFFLPNNGKNWFEYDGVEKTLTEVATLEERLEDCKKIDEEYGSNGRFYIDVYDYTIGRCQD